MIICGRCSTENLDGSQYCDECGAPLAASGANAFKSPVANYIDDREANGKLMTEAASALNSSELYLKPSASSAFAVSANSAPSAKSAAHAKLVVERGRSAGKQFPLHDEESYIGRWDADGGIFPDVDLDADDPEAKVSRRHARIMRYNNQYYIEDLGSTNGTFINRGRRLLPGDRQPLRDGDEIVVGKTFLRFHVIQ